MLFEGRDLATLSEDEMAKIRGNEISMIFQEPMTSLNPVFTVGEQIAESVACTRTSRKKKPRTGPSRCCGSSGSPAEKRMHDYPHQMSGGMRQRVMIGMASGCNPKLLIADEPTTALDVTVQAQILELMKELREKLGMAILLITHDLGVVAEMVDEVAVMYGGKVVEKGPCEGDLRQPAASLTRRRSSVRSRSSACVTPPLSRRSGGWCRARSTGLRVVASPPAATTRSIAAGPSCRPSMPWVGRKPACWLCENGPATFRGPGGALVSFRNRHAGEVAPPIPPRARSDVLLSVRGLKKHFPVKQGFLKRTSGYLQAVDGVDLEVRRGETLGLVGESGCGKSTLGRTLLRFLEPTAGEITFDGVELVGLGSRDMKEMRRHMQIVFQDSVGSLDPRMKVGDLDRRGPHDPRDRGRQGRAMRLVSSTCSSGSACREHADRYPHQFSGGQRQRIGLARALVLQPSLVVADEPVSALDVSIQSQVLNLLVDLKEEFDLTYLFVAHDLAVVGYISDRVAVMYLGQVVELAPSDELFRSRRCTPTRWRCSPRTRGRSRAARARASSSGPSRSEPDRPTVGLPLPHALPHRPGRSAPRSRPALTDHGLDHVAACHFPRHVDHGAGRAT